MPALGKDSAFFVKLVMWYRSICITGVLGIITSIVEGRIVHLMPTSEKDLAFL
jgi:hypothetical protein